MNQVPDWVKSLVGQPLANHEAKLREEFAKVRIKRRGFMFTQDFVPTRLNVHVNDDGVITAVGFG